MAMWETDADCDGPRLTTPADVVRFAILWTIVIDFPDERAQG